MRAVWLADVLRGAGLEVVETAGWQTRGRDFAADPLGIMAHHTASPVASTLQTNLHVVTNGNSVAPGPIAQAMLWRDGAWYVIAAGRANHAGKGSLSWLPGVDTGNQYLLSVEAVNNGVGELWAPAMVVSYEIGTAAILRRLGHGAERATTHAEYAPSRKIDPAGPTGGRIATLPGRSTWDPNAWRAAVGRWLVPPPVEVVPDPPAPPTEEADDMPPIITNIEQHPIYGAPGTGRFVLLESGRLRHITAPAELSARCRGTVPSAEDMLKRNDGTAWTNAELAAAGIA